MGFLKLFWYGLVLAGAGWTTIRFIEYLDVHKVIHKNVPGPCKYVGGVDLGSEDIEVLPNGIAILSAGLVFIRPQGAQDSDFKSGSLKSFDFSKPDEPAKELKLSGFKGRLNPHGLSLYTEGGKTFVYVINHGPFGEQPPSDTVEKFLLDVEKGTATHQKSFSDPEFLGLNDLAVVGMDKFYISNYNVFSHPIMRMLESFLFLVPLQNVVYFDGKTGTTILNGLYGANGLSLSTDKKYLYISEVHAKQISSYKIESATKLIHVDTKALGTVPDNSAVDPETGDIWIGCHPVVYNIFGFLSGYLKKSPSQVLRLGVNNGKFTSAAEVFSDDGTVLSASTCAVPYKGSLIIGTIGHKVLHCKMSGLNSIVKLK